MSEIAASHPQQRSLALTPTPTPPRGPYTKIDFAALATQDADFARIWAKAKAEKSRNDHGHGHAHAHAQLDFQDAETCQVLTKALLRVDFGLSVEVPPDRLCPPVPGRWAYACWVGRLVRETETGGERRGREKEGSMDWETATREQKKIVGLDIGTGASAIYALLLLKANPDWHMCVTDTDPKSFDYAAANIARNGLGDRTTMLRTTGEGRVIPLGDLGVERLDFTICNPPFFADQKEMSDSLRGEGKKKAPNAVCTGSASEMVCSGGDLGFVTRIVEESLVLREKVRWYTSMLGKMSSAKAVVGLLKEKGVRNWAVGCLEPGAAGGGGGTKRWVVAWSFGDRRPANVSSCCMLFLT
jgi:23S rRNA (adenine1618-N6)-methyltransferase